MHVAGRLPSRSGFGVVKTLAVCKKGCLCLPRSRLICRGFHDDIVDVQSGHLPPTHAADQGRAAAGGSPNGGRGFSSQPKPADGRLITPQLVLTGAAAAIVCGVALISTGAVSQTPVDAGAAASSEGVLSSALSAAAASAAAKAVAAIGAVVHHLWMTLSEVRLNMCVATTFTFTPSIVRVCALVSCKWIGCCGM